MLRNEDSFEPPLDAQTMASLIGHGAPQRSLEDEVVRQLREKRMLRDPAVAVAPTRHRARTPWLAAAAAAISFVVGVQVGEGRVATWPSTIGASASTSGQNPSEVSRVVSQTALDYVNALAMVEAGDSVGAELATLTLRIAADQIVRIAPESDVALAFQPVAEEPLRLSSASRGTAAAATQTGLIWY